MESNIMNSNVKNVSLAGTLGGDAFAYLGSALYSFIKNICKCEPKVDNNSELPVGKAFLGYNIATKGSGDEINKVDVDVQTTATEPPKLYYTSEGIKSVSSDHADLRLKCASANLIDIVKFNGYKSKIQHDIQVFEVTDPTHVHKYKQFPLSLKGEELLLVLTANVELMYDAVKAATYFKTYIDLGESSIVGAMVSDFADCFSSKGDMAKTHLINEVTSSLSVDEFSDSPSLEDELPLYLYQLFIIDHVDTTINDYSSSKRGEVIDNKTCVRLIASVYLACHYLFGREKAFVSTMTLTFNNKLLTYFFPISFPKLFSSVVSLPSSSDTLKKYVRTFDYYLVPRGHKVVKLGKQVEVPMGTTVKEFAVTVDSLKQKPTKSPKSQDIELDKENVGNARETEPVADVISESKEKKVKQIKLNVDRREYVLPQQQGQTLNQYASTVLAKGGDPNIALSRFVEEKEFVNFETFFNQLPVESRLKPDRLQLDNSTVLNRTHKIFYYDVVSNDPPAYPGYTIMGLPTKNHYRYVPDIWLQYRTVIPGSKNKNVYQLTAGTEVYKIRTKKPIVDVNNINSLDRLVEMLSGDGDHMLYVDRSTTLKPQQNANIDPNQLLEDNFERAKENIINAPLVEFLRVDDSSFSVIVADLVKDYTYTLESDGESYILPVYNGSLVKLNNRIIKAIFPAEKMGLINTSLIHAVRMYNFDSDIVETIQGYITGQINSAFTWARNSLVTERARLAKNELGKSSLMDSINKMYNEKPITFDILRDNQNFIPVYKYNRLKAVVSELPLHGAYHLLNKGGFIEEFSNFLFKTSIRISNTRPLDTYFKTFNIGGRDTGISTYNSSSRGFPASLDKRGKTIGYELVTYDEFRSGILLNDQKTIPLLSTYFSKVKREPLEFFKKDGTYKYPRSFQVSHSIVSLELSTISGLFKRCLRDFDDNGNLLNFSLLSSDFRNLARVINGDLIGDRVFNFSDNIFSCQTIDNKRVFSSLDVKNAEASVNPNMYEMYFKLIKICLPDLSEDTYEYLRIFCKNQLVNSMVGPIDDGYAEIFMEFMPSGLFCTTDLNHINTSLLIFLAEKMEVKVMEDVGVINPAFLDICLFLGIKLTISLSSVVEYKNREELMPSLKIFEADLLGYDILQMPNGEYAPILNYKRFLKQVVFYRGVDYSTEKAFIVQKSMMINGWGYRIMLPVYVYLLKQLKNPNIINVVEQAGLEGDDELQLDPTLHIIISSLRGSLLPPSIRDIFKILRLTASPYNIFDSESGLHLLMVEGDSAIKMGDNEEVLKSILTTEGFNLVNNMLILKEQKAIGAKIPIKNKPNAQLLAEVNKNRKFDNSGMYIVPDILFFTPVMKELFTSKGDYPLASWHMAVINTVISTAVRLNIDISYWNPFLFVGTSKKWVPNDQNKSQNARIFVDFLERTVGDIGLKVKWKSDFIIKANSTVIPLKQDRTRVFKILLPCLGKILLNNINDKGEVLLSMPSTLNIITIGSQSYSNTLGWCKDQMLKYNLSFKTANGLITHENINAATVSMPVGRSKMPYDAEGYYTQSDISLTQALEMSPYVADKVLAAVMKLRNFPEVTAKTADVHVRNRPLKFDIRGNIMRYPIVVDDPEMQKHRPPVQQEVVVRRQLVKPISFSANPSIKKHLPVSVEDINELTYEKLIRYGDPKHLAKIKVRAINDNNLKNTLIHRYKSTLDETLLDIHKNLFQDKSKRKGKACLDFNESHLDLEIYRTSGELYVSEDIFMLESEGNPTLFASKGQLEWVRHFNKYYIYLRRDNSMLYHSRGAIYTYKAFKLMVEGDYNDFIKLSDVWVPPAFRSLFVDSDIDVSNVCVWAPIDKSS